MGWHGEASKVDWVLQTADATSATMVTALPLAKLAFARKVVLLPGQPVLLVTETVANAAAVGRAYNLVQVRCPRSAWRRGVPLHPPPPTHNTHNTHTHAHTYTRPHHPAGAR